jgi:Asp-tRNA(Asn)/Glu-tRNA(Gln) amidotransferase A subunit family amidase
VASTERLVDLTAAAAARRIAAGALSPVAFVEACLERIRAIEPAVRAWVHVDAEGARAAAREREAEARAGRFRGVLHGVPVGVKDIIDVAGMPTTAGARPFAHRRPAVDAPVVARLRAAGAIVLGKTATTEFAYRDPAPTRNPWNVAHTPGGSSSGSGAGVAARMVPLALGTQTVGSVLRPAAYCGVVGLKGTHGLVPTAGVVPLAWSLDHVGVLARSVEDAALVLGIMSGRSLSVEETGAPRVGVLTELIARGEPDVARHVSDVAERLARAGATVVEVKLPASFGALGEAGLTILEVEAATYHEPAFAVHAGDFGDAIAALVRKGLGQAATVYVGADRTRAQCREELQAIAEAYDALLTPTAPAAPPPGLAWTGDASLCAPWSSTGLPAISLPSGTTSARLPHAVQLVGGRGTESRLLAAAAWCERVLAFAGAPEL